MSYGPNLDNCSYDEEVGMYYDSDSGSYYSEDEDGNVYEAGNDNPIK